MCVVQVGTLVLQRFRKYFELEIFQFLPRDAMHPRYYSHGPVSVRLSICLSVHLSVRHKSEFF